MIVEKRIAFERGGVDWIRRQVWVLLVLRREWLDGHLGQVRRSDQVLVVLRRKRARHSLKKNGEKMAEWFYISKNWKKTCVTLKRKQKNTCDKFWSRDALFNHTIVYRVYKLLKTTITRYLLLRQSTPYTLRKRHRRRRNRSCSSRSPRRRSCPFVCTRIRGDENLSTFRRMTTPGET